MRRTLAGAVVYGVGAAAWVFGYLNVDATWHELAMFIVFVVFTGLVALLIGRFWAILLPLFPLLLSLTAGDAGGNPGGDFNTVFDFALIATPFAAAAAALGVLAARARRASAAA